MFRSISITAGLSLLLAATPQLLLAADPPPFTARNGLSLASDAALTWAEDARLIYIENDEAVAGDGTAVRWGYLFRKERLGQARGYTVRGGKILEASDLEFDFEAPPLSETWIDSQKARAVAEEKAGQKYIRERGGRLSTMMLIRGAFYEDKPDATTWVLLYTSKDHPALHVVVDAARGKVVKTWRG